MAKERITSQKKLILDYLKSVKTHPSAETIYNDVKKNLLQISLGTVYRNLELLKEKGEIIELLSEKKRFDGDTEEHHHFVCEKCGEIEDIFQRFNLTKQAKIKRGKVRSCQIYFKGICQKCQRSVKNKNKN